MEPQPAFAEVRPCGAAYGRLIILVLDLFI